MHRSMRSGECCAISTAMSAGIPPWRKAASRRAGGPTRSAASAAFAWPPAASCASSCSVSSDHDHSFTYCILEAPIPLIDYVATLRLKPVTDGRRTFWEWSSDFRTPPGEESALAALVGEQIYEAGFDAIKAAFGQPPGLRPRSSAAQGPAPIADRSRHRRQWHGGRALRRAGGDALGADRRRAAGPGRGSSEAQRHRAQLHRCLYPQRLLPADPAAGGAGHGGGRGGPRHRSRRPWHPARRPRGLCLRARPAPMRNSAP